jgi:hypothetical protein
VPLGVAVEGYGQVPAWTVWSYLVYVYNAAFAIGNFILTYARTTPTNHCRTDPIMSKS